MAKNPKDIAEIGFYAMQQGKLVEVPTVLYKIERLAAYLLPIKTNINIIGRWQRALINSN